MTKKAKQRKDTPVYSGVINYFPDAIKEVARVSKIGNEQHHPGEPLHWDKPKSSDHEDALLRHLMDHKAGIVWDDDTAMHLGKVAWRALAALQTYLDKFNQEEYEEDIIKQYDEEALEERMRHIGQNGNEGTHYDFVSGTESAYVRQTNWTDGFKVEDTVTVSDENFRVTGVSDKNLSLEFIEE